MVHFIIRTLAVSIGTLDVSTAIIVTKKSVVTRVVTNNKVDPRFTTNISAHNCGIEATTTI